MVSAALLGAAASSGSGPLAQFALRSLATSAAASSAVPAVATAKPSGGGLASLLGFGSARIDVPLSEPLPSPSRPLKGSVPTVPPSLQTGSLTAGTKVAAIDSASPVTALSLVFPAGPAIESESSLGTSRVLEALAFKATANRTTFRLTRELEKIGAVTAASVGRDTLSLTISAPRLHTPELVELLVDAALHPKLNYWEVVEAVALAKATLAAEARDPTRLLQDALHRAAYEGPLGLPLTPDPSQLDGITAATLKAHLAATLNPANVVLAAAGVTLGELTSLANPLVSKSTSTSASAPASTYAGGALSLLAPTAPLTYVGVAIEAKGGAASPKAAAAAAVLSALLDEGRAVLPHTAKEHDVLRSAAGFSSLTQSSGLVGVIASSAPAQGSALLDSLTKKLASLAKPLPEPALRGAKQVAVGRFKAATASSVGWAGTVAPALLAAGKFSAAEHVAAIEGLSAADVAGFVAAGLKAKPTVVTYGGYGARVPSGEDLIKRLA